MATESTTNIRNALMAEIVAIAEVCNGEIPENEQTLWRELAIWANCQPSGVAFENARSVFVYLGESWNDDYLESDGVTPTLAALETTHEGIVRRRSMSGRVNTTDEVLDAEDEDDVGLTVTGNLNVAADGWNITSVMEWISSGRLVLNPEWQRSFVWKSKKQQALIESMLYGLPIPSFLLYQNSAGQMFVIDGRQRLETISRFMGPVEGRGERKIRFKTFSAKQDGWKPGQALNRAANKYYQDLPPDLKLKFDLTSLRMAVLNVELSQLYQIFKRYNTGSVALNAAEIRNAVYQSTPVHEFMFRLAGEHRDPSRYLDAAEKGVSEDFRELMRNKSQRYGAYDFIGRFLAFANETTGSVAKATVSFMDRYANAQPEKLEEFRQQFIGAFKATTRWYEYPLIEPRDGGQFHAWLATIQMVSASHCLKLIASGVVNDEQIGSFVAASWIPFAENKVLVEKQNSTNFWKFQKTWIDSIDSYVDSINQSASAA